MYFLIFRLLSKFCFRKRTKRNNFLSFCFRFFDRTFHKFLRYPLTSSRIINACMVNNKHIFPSWHKSHFTNLDSFIIYRINSIFTVFIFHLISSYFSIY
ncbi:putative acyltransferase with acyl-CoA [Listeria monocytogenes]|nr:putative acyltransferase with acyl-CoA [Listeria monocytogenes]